MNGIEVTIVCLAILAVGISSLAMYRMIPGRAKPDRAWLALMTQVDQLRAELARQAQLRGADAKQHYEQGWNDALRSTREANRSPEESAMQATAYLAGPEGAKARRALMDQRQDFAWTRTRNAIVAVLKDFDATYEPSGDDVKRLLSAAYREYTAETGEGQRNDAWKDPDPQPGDFDADLDGETIQHHRGLVERDRDAAQ